VRALLPFLVIGIATGTVYGLTATGLTLTYKTSGILNFGQGALATAGAYLFYFLHVTEGWSWQLAVAVSVVAAGPTMGWLMERVARQLSIQRTEWKIVGTVGLVLGMEAIAEIAYGTNTLNVPQYLPRGDEIFSLAGVNVQYAQLWVTVVSVLVVVVLYVLFRKSRAGISMRAVVDDPDLVSMQGASAVRIRRVSWLISSTLAALSGVLILPFTGLSATAFTLLVIVTIGASAVGAFSNIPLTFLGAIVIGVGASVSTKYSISFGWLAGLPDAFPVIVLLIVLLVTPTWRLRPVSAVEARQRLQWRAPARVRLTMGVIVLALLASVPFIVNASKLGYYTEGVAEMILMLSLGLLVKSSGQVSLCQATFAAIGAVAFSQLTVDHGWPWLPALLVAGLIAVPVGIIVALPAIRVPGVFFALSTLGFGVLVSQLLYSQSYMFTTSDAGRLIPRPSIAQGDRAYYYLVLVFLVVVALSMLVIDRARIGRMLRGMAGTPVGMVSMGLNIITTRLVVFSISAFLAAVAGILYAGSIHYATGSDPNFAFLSSVTLLALLALAPFAVPWYAIFALVDFVIPGYVTSVNATNWLDALFGVFAVAAALTGGPPSMPVGLRRVIERLGGPPAKASSQLTALAAAVLDDSDDEVAVRGRVRLTTGRSSVDGLEVRDLRVRFGGLVAVDRLSLTAPLGRITGIIGPNGAGKTTAFDAVSGLNRRFEGQIYLHGSDVTHVSSAERARLGLGRTFQRMQLAESLTVAENVALGREAALAGRRVYSQVMASPDDARETKRSAAIAMRQCGLVDLAGVQVGVLSTGQRRLVELARSIAGAFDVLLLDEPSSGLDRDETTELRRVLERIVEERGCGVLLVEHDMSLVMAVCSYIYVLDYGEILFEGDPQSVASSPAVKMAYLGESVEHAGSRGVT
jgi:ABC-type branched-subunit amino acid transport system ATPase component/branched-subunit amino acid ABC-type transport system permease component